MGSLIEPGSNYMLGRDIASRTRLNQQHFIYRKIFGYNLHPAIPRGEGLKVADVATGTGIWMLDLMSELPVSTSYRGFDIDLSQIPPKEWLPSNISFSRLDLFAELPDELVEVFDIVHVRLVLLVVRDDDPNPILDKVLRMLKPGGWLQWTELNHAEALNFVKAKPHLTGSAMEALHGRMASRQGRKLQPTWSSDLPEFFKNSGLQSVQTDEKHNTEILPWLAFTNDIVNPVYLELITNLFSGSERDELMQLYHQVVDESREGTAWNGSRLTVVGQKPMVVIPDISDKLEI